MSLPEPTPPLLSFQRQNLLVEFSSLRFARLDGVFVSITPGDPTLWVGVIFVRKGPYSPAVLRFQISFPPTYPALPPLVTFSTDVFHPLLTPLTTYTYTTGSSDTDTVSATDEERLPPGGFSLRHGFPHWFGRARRSAASSRNVSGSGADTPSRSQTPATLESKANAVHALEPSSISKKASTEPRVAAILQYIQSTFSDEAILDSIPLEAAANPGAYHAWRTYRAEFLQLQWSTSPGSPAGDAQSRVAGNTPTGSRASDGPCQLSDRPAVGRARRPGEWNWEGVWEERVKKAVKASLSEPVLYGGLGGGEIRFLNADQ
ncbi:UBC-like protein [Lepidopterella palustris CBS 459.81]|uniref:UBC-like protein n=1 Tax=Lepidopterella palustris CBS 459.81 TaxID=1314670 RepID=A0A8E2DY95_9PEZI|nr:UBC-like protein [Lepidopterella palustris CBS 459.81]